MTDVTSELDRAAGDLSSRLQDETGPADLTLRAATPLDALDPDLVQLVVGRVQAGCSAFGDDAPRRFIRWRIVVPSTVLGVLDAIGLIGAATSGRTVLAIVAAIFLAALGYLAFAGVRFIRQDPLRVTSTQRERVAAARYWQSSQPWTHELRRGPWAQLTKAACESAGRVAASEAWTWASVAPTRAEMQLATILDGIDAAAYRHAADGTAVDGRGPTVRAVVALQCCADDLDDLVRRSASDEELVTTLPAGAAARLEALAEAARQPS